ncbi:site-2 protease family protein [Massilia glaciei]|uniref:Site-2 protease family protein n=1 Tax=Massilia glaciei TaxID=1524097 RepID=A0A2U2HJW7_9BURK|nr:site-2 protease family protein [Massilia glaciei]PWF47763.1 site-2 protease family protein [Massilia glaciei]
MDEIIRTISVYALPVLFAITLHEAAHAYAAKYYGDSTAFLAGRMSLNPIKHIDPFGTILLPLLLFVASSSLGGGFLFGYAKPVPVEFGKLRNPKRDMAWVALAGPGANLLMALIWLLMLLVLPRMGVAQEFPYLVAQAGITFNLVIFAVNMFPIPPLDGGRVMTSILPDKLAYKFARIEPYGFVIVLAMIPLKLLHYWVNPLVAGALYLLNLLTLPLKFLLN